MLSAEEVQSSDIAGPVVVILFLVTSVIFSLGYLVAVMRRANDDYKKTKAAVPVLRKGFWASWWKMVKTGFVVSIIVMSLLLWWIRGADRQPADANPQPSPSRSGTPRR